MSDTGWVFPGSATEESIGGSSWSNLGYVLSEDGLGAYTSRTDVGDSNRLVVTSFGFTIPAGSYVLGVEVGTKHWTSGYWELAAVELRYGGSAIGTTKSDASIPGSFTWETYGSPSDRWGAALTATVVNDASFGAQFRYTHTVTGALFHSVGTDAIRVRVYYQPPEPPRRLAGGIVVGPASPLRPLVQERHAQILRRQ